MLTRSFRTSDRRFLVEGPQGVREALGEPHALHELFITDDGARRHPDLVRLAGPAGVTVHRVTPTVLATLTGTVTPQGVLGVAAFRDVPPSTLLADRPRLLAILASVRDPGNAGTVLRTSDAAGATGVIFTDGSVDPYNSKCVRASAGSIFHLPLSVGRPAAAAIDAARAAGVRILAADAADAGSTGARDLFELADSGELTRPTGWIFGNEAWGLPDEIRGLADAVVRVPVYGRAESLNLATAAAVCLYASARAQRVAAATGTGCPGG